MWNVANPNAKFEGADKIITLRERDKPASPSQMRERINELLKGTAFGFHTDDTDHAGSASHGLTTWIDDNKNNISVVTINVAIIRPLLDSRLTPAEMSAYLFNIGDTVGILPFSMCLMLHS